MDALNTHQEALRSGSPAERHAAAALLGRAVSKHPEVLPSLIEALSDEVWRVRAAAARGLGADVHAPEALPALVDRALDDDTPWVRAAATWALDQLPADRQRLADLTAPLIAALQHDEGATRARAAGLSVRLAVPDLTEALIAALGDPEWPVRAAAAEALGHRAERGLDDPDAAGEALLNALGDPDPGVRTAAALSLGPLGEVASAPRAEPALLEATTEVDAEVRRAALEALTLRPTQDTAAVAEAARQGLTDAQISVRGQAVALAGSLGGTVDPALPQLVSALDDCAPSVRAIAGEALVDLGRQHASVAQALWQAVQRRPGGSQLRASALELLETLKSPPSDPQDLPLTRLLHERSERVWSAARWLLDRESLLRTEALTLLTASVRDQHHHVRARALMALGVLGSEAALAAPVLPDCLRDPAAPVRVAAVALVGLIGDAAAQSWPHLVRRLVEREAPVESAARSLWQQLVITEPDHHLPPLKSSDDVERALLQALAQPLPEIHEARFRQRARGHARWYTTLINARRERLKQPPLETDPVPPEGADLPTLAQAAMDLAAEALYRLSPDHARVREAAWLLCQLLEVRA